MDSINRFIVTYKNYFSTIFAFLMFAYEPFRAYFMEKPFDLTSFIFLVFGSIVSFSIGKYPGGLVDPKHLTANQENKIDRQGFASSEDLGRK